MCSASEQSRLAQDQEGPQELSKENVSAPVANVTASAAKPSEDDVTASAAKPSADDVTASAAKPSEDDVTISVYLDGVFLGDWSGLCEGWSC